METLFGIPDGDCICFSVVGPTCPQAEGNWYRAQLNVEVDVTVGSFRGYRSLVMFADDFHRFRAALKRLMSGAAVDAWLHTGDFLSIEVSREESIYCVWMQLDALEQDGDKLLLDNGAANWEWRLAMDHASVDRLLVDVTRVSEQYPTWSVEHEE